MDNQDRQNLLEASIVSAQQLGLSMEIVQLEPQLGAARADALIRVRYGDQEVLYAAEVVWDSSGDVRGSNTTAGAFGAARIACDELRDTAARRRIEAARDCFSGRGRQRLP